MLNTLPGLSGHLSVLPTPVPAAWDLRFTCTVPARGSQDGQVSFAGGSDRLAEMTGQAVVITEPLAGVVSLMMGGWPS